MTVAEINAMSRALNPLIKQNKATAVDLSEYQKKKKKSSVAGGYSQDFLDFWEAFPFKTGKGAAWKSWKQVVKDGFNPQEIIDGIPVYISSEAGRKKGCKGEFRGCHCSTWLSAHRFLDEPGGDLSKPRKSATDITCELVGKKVNKLIQGADRISLQECLDVGMTREQIMEQLENYNPEERFSHFCYRIAETTGSGGKD